MDSQSRNSEQYRNEYATSDVYTRAGASLLSKISWGAVLAGVVVSLVTMLVLNLLGIGIGLASINPMTEASPFSGVGTGAIIWWVISNLIAIFAGGYTAARLSGVPLPTISVFHGVLSWCLYTLISFWLLTTAVGSIISGVGSAVSQTLSAAGSVVTGGSGSSGQSGQSGQQSQSSGGLNLDQITSEVKQILRQTDDPALQPDAIENTAENAAQNARQTLRNEDQKLSDQEIGSVLQQVLYKGGNLVDKIDKQDVASVIAARTSMSEDAANNAADAVVRNFNEAQQQLQQVQEQAKQKAEEASAKAADAASSAAIWSFVGLVLGAIVAAASGKAGQPKDDFVDTEKKAVAR